MTLKQQIVEAIEAYPGKYRQVDLTRVLSVSRQYVWQVVNEVGISDKVYKPRMLTFNCYICGKEVKQKQSEFK